MTPEQLQAIATALRKEAKDVAEIGDRIRPFNPNVANLPAMLALLFEGFAAAFEAAAREGART